MCTAFYLFFYFYYSSSVFFLLLSSGYSFDWTSSERVVGGEEVLGHRNPWHAWRQVAAPDCRVSYSWVWGGGRAVTLQRRCKISPPTVKSLIMLCNNVIIVSHNLYHAAQVEEQWSRDVIICYTLDYTYFWTAWLKGKNATEHCKCITGPSVIFRLENLIAWREHFLDIKRMINLYTQYPALYEGFTYSLLECTPLAVK